MSLLIVGSVALDSVKTPYGEVKRALGGSAVYAGIAASPFSKPRIVGVVGEDFPPEYIKLMKKKKFGLEGLKIVPRGKTFHWKGSYKGNMAHAETLDTRLNVFEFFKPDLPEKCQNSQYVFLANIDPELQLYVLEQIRKPRLVICDTMNFWITGKRKALEKVFSKSHVILVNEGEALMLTNAPNLVEAAHRLLQFGPSYVIVKKGEHGAFILNKKDYFSLPAFPLRSLKDPTGAGDSFAGGFLGYLAGQNRITACNIRRAMAVGTVMASFVCEDFSVKKTASLTKRQISERIKKFHNMASLPRIRL